MVDVTSRATKKLETHPQQGPVRDHYRKLADQYGARANQSCERTYQRLVQQFLHGRRRVLELGAGCTNMVDLVESPFAVACDLSEDMLRLRIPRAETHCLVTTGERLPFNNESFDGLFHINLLEHVTNVDIVMDECARVLQPGGIWFGITPNGNWEFWLALAERWSLKIPEGPHAYLTTGQLRATVSKRFEEVEHKTFLVFPAGPPALAKIFDRLTFCSAWHGGFFQYLVAKKRPIFHG